MLGFDGLWFPTDVILSADCKSLLHNMIDHDPEKRISFEEFYNHPWVQNAPIIGSKTPEISVAQTILEPKEDPIKVLE